MENYKYFLGWFKNDDGTRYCAVYSNEIPQIEKNNLNSEHQNDIWNQVYFTTPDYFWEQVKEGYADPVSY